MARITIEDCTKIVPDRFELVALAGQRAKYINSGGEVVMTTNAKGLQDKITVQALRDIADGQVSPLTLRELLIRTLRNKSRVDTIDSSDEENEAAETFDYIPEGQAFHVTNDFSDLDDSSLENGDLEDNNIDYSYDEIDKNII